MLFHRSLKCFFCIDSRAPINSNSLVRKLLTCCVSYRQTCATVEAVITGRRGEFIGYPYKFSSPKSRKVGESLGRNTLNLGLLRAYPPQVSCTTCTGTRCLWKNEQNL